MRYRGPRFRISRALGYSTLETGKEFSTGKQRRTIPGQHGNTRRRRGFSDFGRQLKEKQKLKFTYGITEKQLKKVYNLSNKSQKESLSRPEYLIVLLESRLDNMVYRMGFAVSRREARQLVNHNHIVVNGKKQNIPSFSVLPGDKIAIKEKSKNLDIVNRAIKDISVLPKFVEIDKNKKEGNYLRYPTRKEVANGINENMIIEYYSK